MIVVGRRSMRVQPPATPGAEPAEDPRILGLLLNPQLSMGDHIDRTLSSGASSKFSLRTLRSHGLRPQELHLVARATTVAFLQYASPAWWGFATEEQRNRLKGLRRCDFLPVDVPSFEALATEVVWIYQLQSILCTQSLSTAKRDHPL